MEEKRTDKMKKKREDEREKRDKMKKKREDERENGERDERRDDFFEKKCLRKPPYPPDELAQDVSKKSLSDELLLHFSSKVQNLTVFSIIYMIRIRFSGRENQFREHFGLHSTQGHVPERAEELGTREQVLP